VQLSLTAWQYSHLLSASLLGYTSMQFLAGSSAGELKDYHAATRISALTAQSIRG
jgi:hypothetical protein